MQEHHDAELCRNLAEKVMKGHPWLNLRPFYTGRWRWMVSDPNEKPSAHPKPGVEWDPCCNPSHSWMLEEEIVSMNAPCPDPESGDVYWCIRRDTRLNPKTGELEAYVMVYPERAIDRETADELTFEAKGHPLHATAAAINQAVSD